MVRLRGDPHRGVRRGKRLRALADWIFGGGANYCEGCRTCGSPCARGERGDDGRFCPQIEHAPHSEAGRLAWSLSTSPGAWKTAGLGGLAGLDWAGLKALSDGVEGADWPTLAELFREIEAGALKGAARKADNNRPSQDHPSGEGAQHG